MLVTAKGRKHDLPVKTGDHISIIRTTNCPKGKWLARDGSNNCEFMSIKKKNRSFISTYLKGEFVPVGGKIIFLG